MAGNNVLVGPLGKVVLCTTTNAAAVLTAATQGLIQGAGGLVLGVREGTGVFDEDMPESTDTNDTPDKAYAMGNHAMRWTIRTYRQTTGALANGPPHGSLVGGNPNTGGMGFVPTGLGPGGGGIVVACFIFPYGFTGGAAGTTLGPPIVATNAYVFPVFKINQFRPTLRVEGSANQEFDFDGTSSGAKGIPTLV
jgi:hypothetical protein